METQNYGIWVQNFHLDGYGHVNNARYLEFLEAARWDYFRQLGLQAALREWALVVAHLDMSYRHAASHNDFLHIHSEIKTVQSRQLVLNQTVIIDSLPHKPIAAYAQITLMPTHNGKVCRLPENLLAQFNHIQNQ